ncbi:MAG: M42 family metallopeptidase [Caldilineales bacterium]
MIKIDITRTVDFLVGLLNTPSPTGDTAAAIDYVRTAFAALPLAMHLTNKGALAATWEGRSASAPRALTAHVDTLGGMVKEIKDSGRLQLVALGGLQWGSVEGEGLTVFTADGQRCRGSFLPNGASAHALRPENREARRDDASMEVRIDALTSSRAETEALGIRVGDFVAFDPRVEVSQSGFVRSRFLDDKVSVACIYGALWALADAGMQPAQRTTFLISNYEEVGHGAASGFPADLTELVAVDMAVVAPGHQSHEQAVTICAKDAGGPYDLGLRRRLEALAEAEKLDWCTDVYLYYRSDGEAYWQAGGDVRVGLIGPGVDASHHYERTHVDGIENTARLIAAYLLS